MSEPTAEELAAKNAELLKDNKKLRDNMRDLSESMKRFDGIDPEAFKAMQTEAEKRKQADLETAGKWEEAKAEMERQHKAQMEAMQKDAGDWRSRFEDRAINSELLSAANKGNAVNADQVASLLRTSVRLSDDGAVEVVGSDGKVSLDDKGNALSVSGYVESFLSDNAHFVRASGGGTGSAGGMGAGKASGESMTGTQKIAAGLAGA